MRRYTVNLIPDDDGGYSVMVPAFPNIHTCGDTIADALAMAQDAIELYVGYLRDEGEPIPDDVTQTTAVVEVAA